MVKLPEKGIYMNLPIWQELAQGRVGRLYTTSKPTKLLELEEFAKLAANYLRENVRFARHESKTTLRQIAMNQLRSHFNLEFKLVCHICETPHYQDEISAPER